MALMETLGIEIEEADDDGKSVASLVAGDKHLNLHGTVHGGVLAALVDSAMGAALAAARHGEGAPVTVALTVTYLAPAPPGQVRAEAVVRRLGHRITVVEADVVAEDGTVAATALGTFSTTS